MLLSFRHCPSTFSLLIFFFFSTRFFKGETNTDVEQWVSAIRSAGQQTKAKAAPAKRGSVRGGSIFASKDGGAASGDEGEGREEVTVQIVSVKSARLQREVVAARSPAFDRIVTLPDFHTGYT